MKKQITLESICALIIILFLYASISKYIAFKTFESDMHKQPFPLWISGSLIVFLPPIEIFIAVSLAFNKTRLIGLYASFVLMLLFTTYTAAILLNFFPHRPCGCGGVIRSLTWRLHLTLNTFFTLLSLSGIYLQRKQKTDTTTSIPTSYKAA
jgi:putative oxidoreductase